MADDSIAEAAQHEESGEKQENRVEACKERRAKIRKRRRKAEKERQQAAASAAFSSAENAHCAKKRSPMWRPKPVRPVKCTERRGEDDVKDDKKARRKAKGLRRRDRRRLEKKAEAEHMRLQAEADVQGRNEQLRRQEEQKNHEAVNQPKHSQQGGMRKAAVETRPSCCRQRMLTEKRKLDLHGKWSPERRTFGAQGKLKPAASRSPRPNMARNAAPKKAMHSRGPRHATLK